MWTSALELARAVGDMTRAASDDLHVAYARDLADGLTNGTYSDIKKTSAVREEVKRFVQSVALKGWTKNSSDEDWHLSSIR